MTPAPIRAMLIDDDPLVRRLLTLIFEDAGGDVRVVADVNGLKPALAALDEADPHVIVVDLRMPVADGFETARRIRERRPGQLVVLCSGHVDADVRREADEAGIAYCVAKDNYLQLPSIVRELVGAQEDGTSRA